MRPAAPIQLVLLSVAAMAALFARTAVNPLQETIRIALSLSDNQMALLQGPALALLFVVATVPLGLVIDRYSRVRILFLLAALDTTGTVFTALAPNFVVLLLARCLIGLTTLAMNPVAFSLAADMFVPAERGRASMAVLVGQWSGVATAFVVGGLLAAATGSAAGGWRWAMLWLAVPLVVVMLLILALREPPRVGFAIENLSVRAAFAELWGYRAAIAPVMAGLVMAEIATGAVIVWGAPVLARNYALAPDRVGLIMAVAMLVGGLMGSIMGGILADKCQREGGPRLTMSLLRMLGLLSVLTGFFAVMPEPASASILLVAFMTIVGAIIVIAITLFTVVIPDEVRGLCLSASIGASVLFGIALAPLTVSLLSSAIGGPNMIGKALATICVAAGLLGTASFAFGRRYFARTTAP